MALRVLSLALLPGSRKLRSLKLLRLNRTASRILCYFEVPSPSFWELFYHIYLHVHMLVYYIDISLSLYIYIYVSIYGAVSPCR